MATYLITGGAGFIGSNFIHYLMENNPQARVINLDKLTYAGNLRNLAGLSESEHYHFIQGDIRDRNLAVSIFNTYKPDYVLNFAAETHVDRSISGPLVFFETNVLGTQSLLDAALEQRPKKFLQISTDEVYGPLIEGSFTEDALLKPTSPYAASKAGADLLVLSYLKTYGLSVNITRCSNNYGPRQFPEKLIPLTINRCLENQQIPIYGTGKNIRSWLYVSDHCAALMKVLHQGRPGEAYNICGPEELPNIEVVREIIKEVSLSLSESDARKKNINDGMITYVRDRLGHDRRYALDINKIEKELDWQPQIGFAEGLKKTIAWYLKNQKWLEEAERKNKSY